MVARNRFDYTTAVADSWKRQMLLNLVKIRYGDTPVFLDVASIISQYELEGTFSAVGTSSTRAAASMGFPTAAWGSVRRGSGRIGPPSPIPLWWASNSLAR